jgi:hypothetical protein
VSDTSPPEQRTTAAEIKACIDSFQSRTASAVAAELKTKFKQSDKHVGEFFAAEARDAKHLMQSARSHLESTILRFLETSAGVPAVQQEGKVYPTEITPALSEVLQLTIMSTAPVARFYRTCGYDIPRKVEAEQAFMLHRLIGFALEHGDKWREVATAELDTMSAALPEAPHD